MIRYPIIVGIGGLRVPFADAAGLLARYDDIFTPALRDAIARGSSDVVVETSGWAGKNHVNHRSARCR